MVPRIASAVLLFMTCACSSESVRPPSSDTIATENLRPGDPSWRLTSWQPQIVEGYGDAISLRAGDTLHVAVSTGKPMPVTYGVYRMGWYGGAGARLVGSGGPFNGTLQSSCAQDPVTQRVECNWSPSFAWPIAADAVSGVYLVKLHTDEGESYVPFVVVDGRAADMVLDVNVTSWQAYNDYQGESLYADASGKMPSGKAWEVSFDRPFNNDRGAGRYLDWEQYFVPFIEALGYDVTYTTAFDIAADPETLKTAKVFVSVANDEYWLPAEHDAVAAARDAGVNLAWLGADQSLWRIRAEPSSGGRPNRVIVCYKDDQSDDPMLAKLGAGGATARFRDAPNADPENGLIGVMYEAWLTMPQGIVVAAPDHWAFAGTGLAAGDALPGLVSGEFDNRYANGDEPAGLVALAKSQVVNGQGAPDTAVMASYTAASGAEVFAVGSIGWPTGLGATPYANPAAARITRNVLDRFTGTTGAPDPDGAPWTKAGSKPVVDGRWASSVSTVASGLAGPAGVAVAPDGTIFVAETLGQRITRISAGGQVTAYAGDGNLGSGNAQGALARFRWPVGLAIGRDGTLYVADSVNNVVRAIGTDPKHLVSTYAGQVLETGDFADGPGASAKMNRPVAVAVEADGTLLVADMQNGRIRSVGTDAAHTVTTLLVAGLDTPSALVVGAGGTIYYLDTYFHALGAVGRGTIVGGSDQGVNADGPAASAHISAAGGLVVAGGVVYFTDTANQRIRALDLATQTVYTVAGNGRAGLVDGGGAAAQFATPLALAVAPDGTLVVADAGNGAVRRIRL